MIQCKVKTLTTTLVGWWFIILTIIVTIFFSFFFSTNILLFSHGQTLRWHLIFLAIAGIILLAGRFFKLFLILSDQIPISCFYSGTCTDYAGGIAHCNDNIAQLAGDVVKVEILSIILASVFCVSGGPPSQTCEFCQSFLWLNVKT